jgi:hypothetical protein
MILSFLFLILSTPFVFAQECGLYGRLEERVSDCNQTKNTHFTVVSRDQWGREVHLMKFAHTNVQTSRKVQVNLLWSAVKSEPVNYFNAKMVCSNKMIEALGLSQYKWRLPTSDEFLAAFWAGVENGKRSNTREILNLGKRLVYTSELNEYSMPYVFSNIVEEGYRYFIPVPQASENYVICASFLN